RSAQHQVTDGLLNAGHERFRRYSPAGGYRREEAIFISSCEPRTSIIAGIDFDEVATFEIVVESSKEGLQCPLRCSTRRLVVVLRTCIDHTIIGEYEIVTEGTEVSRIECLDRRTHHQLEVVLSDLFAGTCIAVIIPIHGPYTPIRQCALFRPCEQRTAVGRI